MHDDFSWRDESGHGCTWWHARTQGSGICDRAAKARCPVACSVVFYCAERAQQATKVFPQMMVLSDYRVCPALGCALQWMSDVA